VVFQNHSLLPWLTVYENVRLAVDKVFGGKKSAKERNEWTMHNLELVHMAEAKGKRPAEISGGMKQRVGIARALAMEPKVLLMDEPFGALDAFTREEMGFHLLRMWDSERKTIIFVTHSITEAVLLADRVIVMARAPGRVVRDVRVDLERPRTPDHEFTGEFDDHARELRALLFDQRPTGPPARL
jgi:nitrate/nitrite transport system ATP-binding protein